MELKHKTTLDLDEKEALSSRTKAIIALKQVAYFFTRIFFDTLYRIYGYSALIEKTGIGKINLFLRDEGGMFKSVVYKKCDQISSLKGKDILVPGVGYGRNLFQLAVFKPKKIVGFDLYDYPEEWEYVGKNLKKYFGVEVEFKKGGFESMDNISNSFDWIISDAVLEHVGNLDKFMLDSYRLLKKGGYFYASFGPIWYGPSGDHMDWGIGGAYNHIIQNENEYHKGIQEKEKSGEGNSVEGTFLVKNKIFSYLALEEYFRVFYKNNFRDKLKFLKVSSVALRELASLQVREALEEHKAPKLDRFISGAYVWLKKE